MPVRYLTQAAAGQDQLQRNQIAIDEIVRKGWFSHETRALLAEVAVVKAFGEAHGLRATNELRAYVDLGRPAVIWVVDRVRSARVPPAAWTLPDHREHHVHRAGSSARTRTRYADELRGEGWDVDVRPSQAYSTLGWFDDPILSTMIAEGATRSASSRTSSSTSRSTRRSTSPGRAR